KEDEKEAKFTFGEHSPLLGQSLTVEIEPETEFINIYYQTTDKAEALDWLSPDFRRLGLECKRCLQLMRNREASCAAY
ncbi:MAG: hypothetical protein JKY60_05750, partial [Kordiimonadaceae bacterium]|nr:hypothetical protein [Kordiimonadaceae bacterium]